MKFERNRHPKTILVVNNNGWLRKFTADFLRWRNYSVIEAEDGLEGWQMTMSNKPDLILSDIDTPSLNGYELLEKLHQEPTASMIPVILFSSRVTTSDQIEALNLGAFAYLSKLVSPHEILRIISTKLNPIS